MITSTIANFRAALYNMGLGKDDRSLVLVCLVALLLILGWWRQSTFGMAGTKGEKMDKLQIVEAASALR